MNNTEKNIKKVLTDHNELEGLDINLEDNIMAKINSQTDYKAILLKTKRKAKIGISISLVLVALYAIVTYFELLTSNKNTSTNLTNFIPALFTVLVVIVVYFEMTFGVAVFRKNLQD